MSKNSFLIGGVSGVISQALTWPFEYLKTIKQLPSYKNQSVFNIFKNSIKNEGIISLYKGAAPQLISAFPRAAVRFVIYDNVKNYFEDENGEINTIKKLSCGVIAGGIEAATVMTPAEVIKVQTINKNISPLKTMKMIYKSNGLPGFYKGILPTTIRQATTQGISFFVYDWAKFYYENYGMSQNYSGLIAGMTGGITAVAINNPLDAVKTYKQSDKGTSSLLEISKEIYQKKGLTGFYRGGLLRMIRVAPLHGITFFTFDYLKRIND